MFLFSWLVSLPVGYIHPANHPFVGLIGTELLEYNAAKAGRFSRKLLETLLVWAGDCGFYKKIEAGQGENHENKFGRKQHGMEQESFSLAWSFGFYAGLQYVGQRPTHTCPDSFSGHPAARSSYPGFVPIASITASQPRFADRYPRTACSCRPSCLSG